MVGGRSFGDDSCSRILNQLELMEGLVRETEEERVTVIQAGGDEAVNKNGGSVGSE